MKSLIRTILLYFHYLVLKVAKHHSIDFIGFTVVYHDKKSKIDIKGVKNNKVHFHSDRYCNMLGITQRCIVVARHGGSIEIGEGTAISGSTIYAMDSITIGKRVLVGVSCKIIDNDFHPLRVELRKPYNPETIKKRPVKIGDNCFIGANSLILKGTTLGNNVVVGAGSVVCGTFPDNVIIAGNPARIIKENI